MDILKNKGTINRKKADKIAKKEYGEFRPIQDKDYKSDYYIALDEVFDEIKIIKGENN